MKKSNITISFTYAVNETPKANLGSIDDAIASELLAIKAAEQGAKAMRETLRGFIKENIGAVNPDAIEAILKANKWSKQDISKEMLAFGLRRRAANKAKLALSQKLQSVAESEFATLKKTYSAKEIAAIGRRLQILAQQRSK
jgi:uncharacterized protein (DUF2267 family)